MDNTTLLAIIDAIVKEHINSEENLHLRGPRGLRGKPGKGFDFQESKPEIYSLINDLLSERSGELKLKFSDLTDEEKHQLKLKFSDLTDSDIAELKGKPGKDGKDGKNFIFDDHKETIFSKLKNYILDIKDELKLKFSDLTENEKNDIRGEKGPRGQRGKPGKGFVFEENEEKINESINNAIEIKKDDLKLKFSDLTELDKLEIKGETGPRGPKGRDGKDFRIEENEDLINHLINNSIDHKKDELKLKFSDLTEIEKDQIKGERGPRGQRGKSGRDFVFEENEEKINQLLESNINSKKDELKLKFSDLTFEEKDQIKGERGEKGPRGQRGRQGESAYDVWLSNGNDGTIEDYLKSLVGPRGPMGPKGSPGVNGLHGLPGLNGKDGKDAPYVIDVEVVQESEDELYFVFHYSNGTKIETNEANLPSITNIIQGVMVSSSSNNAQRLQKTFICGENIAALKLIRLDASQQAFIATNNATYSDARVIGISLGAGLTGENITVLLFGLLEDPSFVFNLNDPIFLGTNGDIQQLPPTNVGEFITEVGNSLGAGANFMNIIEPLEIV